MAGSAVLCADGKGDLHLTGKRTFKDQHLMMKFLPKAGHAFGWESSCWGTQPE
jgi:hypothetical protein